MELKELRERLRKLHPVIQGAICTALAGLTFFVEQWLVDNAADFKKEALSGFHRYEMDTFAGITDLVLRAPLEEEVLYRGPVWLIALLAALIFHKRAWNSAPRVAAYVICALVLLPLNYLWAFSHCYYPYTIFVFGLVWGGCAILTRRLHYCILLHAGSNAIAVLGVSAIHYLSAN